MVWDMQSNYSTYITRQEPGANFLPLWIKYSAVLVQV